MEAHEQAVASIAKQVRHYQSLNKPFRISHGSTNSTRPSTKTATISTADLSHVLHIDASTQTALVEPNVPMDALVSATMKHGLIPPVVMEFPGITVGGGYSGTSGESSSFKHGFFNETLNWVELVLGNGDVVRASKTEHADLFYGAAGACGTLGVITLAEIQLVPASTYVETTYHKVSSVEEAVSMLETSIKDESIDYLDGILFSATSGAVIVGRLTDRPSDEKDGAHKPIPICTYTKATDPWFYRHVQKITSSYITNNELTNSPPSTFIGIKRALGISPPTTNTTSPSPSLQNHPSQPPNPPQTELIPTKSYLLRYDRGGFWVGRSAFRYFHDLIPFNSLTRWFLDDFMRTRMLYKALHASGYSDRYMVQDCAVPYDRAVEFVEWCEKETGIWPLWLCPLRRPRVGKDAEGTFHPSSRDGAGEWRDMLNVGLWGVPPLEAQKSSGTWVALNRKLEDVLQRLEGRKWLYAHSYYTREEFDSVYGTEWYEGLRKKYHAGSLPVVWEKVSRSAVQEVKQSQRQDWSRWVWSIWPLIGLYGVFAAVLSGEYRKARGTWWHPEE